MNEFKMIYKCKTCGREFEDYIYRNREYCSQSCRSIENGKTSIKYLSKFVGTRGEDSPNWRGGRLDSDSRGYIKLYTGYHKMQYEHIIVMESHLRRKLNPNEVVHHKNGIKNDNRVENLIVLTKSNHMKHHQKERAKDNWSLKYGNKCNRCSTSERKHESRGYCKRCYQFLHKRDFING